MSYSSNRAFKEGYESTREEVSLVIQRLDKDNAWDTLRAADLDPKLVNYVCAALQSGHKPLTICKDLGLAGTNSPQWKKIQAHLRQGFRADAEIFIYQKTHEFYQTIERARRVLEDAFERGTPMATADKDGRVTVTYVQGATKELATFIKSYSEAIATPVNLWKAVGAIGEKKDSGPGGVTIVVKNNIQMPTEEEIVAHQKEIQAKAEAIETYATQVHTK